jgi:hypothetical protein
MGRVIPFLVLVLLVTGCSGSAQTRHSANTSQARLFASRPEAPANVKVTSADGSASPSWSLPVASRGYGIEVDRWTTGSLPALYKTLPAGTTTLNETGLANGTRYFYLIVVKDKRGVLSGCRGLACALPVAPPPVEVQTSGGSSDTGARVPFNLTPAGIAAIARRQANLAGIPQH